MQNIIVPTDFSTKAHHAFSLAKKIAGKTGATIHLIHVQEPIIGSYASTGEILEQEMDDVYTLKLEKKLCEELGHIVEANTSNSFGLRGEIKIGNPFKEIEKKVKEVKADLMVIGDKGYNDPEDFFLGSLTDKIVRSISCPVVTVKEDPDDNAFQNIVYATDLREEHQPLIKLLAYFQSTFGSTIHLVKVNTRKDFANDIDTQVALRKLVDKYELKDYTLNSYSHEDEEYGIVYFADEKSADLIAMGVHERSGFRRLISGGSLAHEIVDHTYRPVLTYHFNHR